MHYEFLNIRDFNDAQYQAMYSNATPERREKADRFRFEDDRKRCLCADMLARSMLAKASGVAPESITFSQGERGKPNASVPYHFNVSHSGDVVLCCVADSPIGADIELVKPFRSGLIARFCADSEAAFIWGGFEAGQETVTDSAVCERFYRVWTAKEAYAKMTGTGISIDLKSIIYDPFAQSVCGIPLYPIDTPQGYVASIIKAPV